MRRIQMLVGLLVVVAACDPSTDSSSGPTAPPTSPPISLLGTYRAETFWTGSVLVAGVPLYSRSCAGALTVASQSGGNWTGTFTAGAPCPTKSGAVSGTVDGAGAVRLTYDASGVDATPLGQVSCDVALPAGNRVELNGRLTGATLDLSTRLTATCGTPPITGTLELRANGVRG